MMRPDGMGADRYHERQNMKEARHIERQREREEEEADDEE